MNWNNVNIKNDDQDFWEMLILSPEVLRIPLVAPMPLTISTKNQYIFTRFMCIAT